MATNTKLGLTDEEIEDFLLRIGVGEEPVSELLGAVAELQRTSIAAALREALADGERVCLDTAIEQIIDRLDAEGGE